MATIVSGSVRQAGTTASIRIVLDLTIAEFNAFSGTGNLGANFVNAPPTNNLTAGELASINAFGNTGHAG